MKKIILNFVSPILLPLIAILAIGPGCGPGPTPTASCASSLEFMNLYNSFGTDQYTLDYQTYEYTFISSVSGNICEIGYEGHPNLVSLAAYKIEILDAASLAVLSTGNYTFTSGTRSYHSVSVPISAGQSYIVRRTVTNINGDITNTISHSKPITSLPITVGSITITATKTYEQYTASAPYNINVNNVLPCIDIRIN
jgi:hypothetical protein